MFPTYTVTLVTQRLSPTFSRFLARPLLAHTCSKANLGRVHAAITDPTTKCGVKKKKKEK